jgi:hypothetical protein
MLKITIPKLIFFLGSFASIGKLFSQEIINGIVVSSNDKNPVQYAALSIEKRAIHRDADSSGRFVISVFASDTILVSCIGFIEKRITGQILKQEGVVELQPKVYELPTVYAGEFNSIKVDLNEKKVSYSMAANLPERTEYATLLRIPDAVKVYTISKLSFAIRNRDRKSISCNPVRVHVYEIGSNGSPGAELLKKDVVITEMNIVKNRLEVEIKDQDITLSARSFFVGIQWLSPNPQNDYKQPQICFTRKVNKSLTWYKARFNNFNWYIQKEAVGWGNMLVQAEIIIRE